MQQAIPYRSWTHTSTTHFNVINPHTLTKNKIHNTIDESSHKPSSLERTMVVSMVSDNAIIVFARQGCCMSHVVKRLLLGLGVNPAIHEVEEKDEVDMVRELESIIASDDGKVQFPAVFIGGKLFGGLDRIMATHISGELVPILKQAGALWL
ncbi:glutaredoxin-C9-like [Cicer arietinum]|uniref:Glutaredoxin-C9-like n=1 Tax=Cicer arietinum TaxID=3827 RepID=A0A1S2YJP0_CICAR|nr:glutaredoxin-C9-like [Cicer arietinum]